MSAQSSVSADEAAIGFPWGWVVLTLVLVALFLAIHSELQGVTRRTRWHDDALSVYAEGDALGDLVRAWAAHPDDATGDTWADVVGRHDRLVMAAELLAEEAPRPRQHERAKQLADETRNLRRVVTLRTSRTPETGTGASDDLARAAVSFDAALFQFRGAL